MNADTHVVSPQRDLPGARPDDRSGPGAVEPLVHQLIETIRGLTRDLPPARVEQILSASEMLAVAALHAQASSEEARVALTRSTLTAERDPLTGLPNRVLFRDRLSQALAHARRRGGSVAILFIDLDGFKSINDRLGHSVGDEVLRYAARCLTAAGRDVDTVSRHGGDEFLVLLSEVSSAGSAATYADKVLAMLRTPFRVGTEVLEVRASIGISLYPDDGEDEDTLIRIADAAMYVAKRSQTSRAFASTSWPGPEAAVGSMTSAGAPDALLERALDEARRTIADLSAANERLGQDLAVAEGHKLAAELSARHQAELLNVVAHELRNSLAPLQSASDVMALVGTDTTLMPRLELILRRQINHMSRLLADLLEVSRLNNGRIHLDVAAVDLKALAIEVTTTRALGAHPRQHQLLVRTEREVVMVTGDPARIRQLLEGLLDGAAALAPEGEGLQLLLTDTPDDVRLTVMPASLGAILEQVERAAEMIDVRSVLPEGPGTGLQLLVVNELARSHGGSLGAFRASETAPWSFRLLLPSAPQ